jgi:beta-glucosidase-like glycosyl hydrolase
MQTDPFHSKYTMGRFIAFWVEETQALHVTPNSATSETTPASTTIKHFVANDIEDSDGYTRHTYDANISNYMAADTYFPAYRTAIREGGALGVM